MCAAVEEGGGGGSGFRSITARNLCQQGRTKLLQASVAALPVGLKVNLR